MFPDRKNKTFNNKEQAVLTMMGLTNLENNIRR